jgi:hypothetical protein
MNCSATVGTSPNIARAHLSGVAFVPVGRVKSASEPRVRMDSGMLWIPTVAKRLAVRDWARRDEAVVERLRRVDNRRMALLREMIGTFCADADEVEARSMAAFCVAIGEHFLAADHGDRTRAQVLAHVADLLLDRPRKGHGQQPF